MDKKLDKSNLGYLDVDFQYKLVKIFIEDPSFFEDIASIVDQNAFTDVLLRTFVGTLKDYYQSEGVVPSYEMMGLVLNKKAKTQNDIDEWTALIKKLRFETSYEGYSIVKDTALKFFRQQNLIKVANKILEVAGNGDIDKYDDCQRYLTEAMIAGNDEDFGYNIYDMMDKALSNDYTVSIPTGIKQLDEVLGGGLDKGKLGLLIAPAGFGKTSFTTAIDSFAATYKCDMNNNQGFKVLQIYFEDDDVDITRKHYSRMKQMEARLFKRLNQQDREEISQWLMNHKDKEMLKNNLRLKHFKTGTKTATDIEIFVRRLINTGFKPDLISIDYFECLAPEKGGYSTDTEWTREGVTMRKLENMAHELDCAIWIPTQGTKDSMNSTDVVRMDQASGSAKKVHVAQLILSIARAIGDIDKSKAVITVLKNRSGKSGKIFSNVKFDNGTSTISCDEIQEFDDDLIYQEEMEKQTEKVRIDNIRDIADRRKNNSTEQVADNENNNEGNFAGVFKPNENF